ncbi:MAG: hypothetical protein ABIJ33_03480 [Patescibacteria group bacterium]
MTRETLNREMSQSYGASIFGENDGCTSGPESDSELARAEAFAQTLAQEIGQPIEMSPAVATALVRREEQFRQEIARLEAQAAEHRQWIIGLIRFRQILSALRDNDQSEKALYIFDTQFGEVITDFVEAEPAPVEEPINE